MTTRRVRRVVTDRVGGVSAAPYDRFNLADHVGDDAAAVTANRARLAAGLGVAAEMLVWMEPIHGRRIEVVDGPRPEGVSACDGLVTTRPGLVLVALSADCVPVLLADTTAGVVAAVHAGRAGVRLGIAGLAVEAMVGAGALPERIDVLLGPAICGRHYEVPAPLQRDVERVAPGSAVTTATGAPGLDLRLGLDGQLRAAGVRAVVADARCTFEDTGLFSYRRDGRTGRHAGLVWLA